jgi:hypothetical protein
MGRYLFHTTGVQAHCTAASDDADQHEGVASSKPSALGSFRCHPHDQNCRSEHATLADRRYFLYATKRPRLVARAVGFMAMVHQPNLGSSLLRTQGYRGTSL